MKHHYAIRIAGCIEVASVTGPWIQRKSAATSFLRDTFDPEDDLPLLVTVDHNGKLLGAEVLSRAEIGIRKEES